MQHQLVNLMKCQDQFQIFQLHLHIEILVETEIAGQLSLCQCISFCDTCVTHLARILMSVPPRAKELSYLLVRNDMPKCKNLLQKATTGPVL